MAPSLALAATGNPWATAYLLANDVAQVARALSTQDPMGAAFAAFSVVGNISALKNAGKYLRGLRHGQQGTQAAKSSAAVAEQSRAVSGKLSEGARALAHEVQFGSDAYIRRFQRRIRLLIGHRDEMRRTLNQAKQ